MEKLYLIYINSVGKDWQGNYLYEFLYSNTIKDIDGNDWDAVPAANRPEPPHEEFVKKVGKLTTNVKLSLVQESDTFSVWDAVDGVIALGWENIDEYDEYPEVRLWFKFGEDIKTVNDKLYEKDIVLEYSK
jgi:hypothetical protein